MIDADTFRKVTAELEEASKKVDELEASLKEYRTMVDQLTEANSRMVSSDDFEALKGQNDSLKKDLDKTASSQKYYKRIVENLRKELKE